MKRGFSLVGRLSLVSLCLIAGFYLLGQEAESNGTSEVSEARQIEEVHVTGSWIQQKSEATALSVTRIGLDELRARGEPNVMDLVRSLPSSQGADSESDQYGSRTGADRATINFRGLGPSRSLVLLNSRRLPFSPGSLPDQAQLVVDLNLLPESAIERVELLRDGGAGTYGSDAVAGVVNFITRSNFKGFETSVTHRTFSGSDGESRFSAIAGGNLGSEDVHVVSSIGMSQRSPVRLGDMDWAVRPYQENPRGGWSGTGKPNTFVPLVPFLATNMTGSDMFNVAVVDPNCENVGGVQTRVPASNPNGGRCNFQYTPFTNLIQETTRTQWFTEAVWSLSPTTEMSSELLLARTDVPEWFTSPSYPPSRVIDLERVIQANNPSLVDMANKHPHLYGDYASCAEVYCRWTGDGGEQDALGIPAEWQNVGWINGRQLGQEGPRRTHPRVSEVARFVIALDGERGDSTWRTSFTSARSSRREEDADTLDYRLIRSHLGLAGFDCERAVPNEVDADGRLNFDWRTLRDHAGQGPCRYWFPFSNAQNVHEVVPNAHNPDYEPSLDHRDLADYLMTVRGFDGTTTLLALDALVSGPLNWELGGGIADYALGTQLRRESYERVSYSAENGPRGGALHDLDLYPCRAGPDVFDCTFGRTGVFTYLPRAFDIDAWRQIYAVFGEMTLPIQSTFSLSAMLRAERYSDGVSTVDPKLAGRWDMSDQLTWRFSIGTSFRAPTLNQAQSGTVGSSRQFISRIGTFKPIYALGSPDLAPEKALSYTLGLEYVRDDFIGNSSLVADVNWWGYRFKDPILLEPHLAVLNFACPTDATECDRNSDYFGNIVFGGEPAVSDIASISVGIVNGPNMNTSGLDFNVELRFDNELGNWGIGVTGTNVLAWDLDAWRFGSAYDALGKLNYDTPLARTVVDWKTGFYAELTRARFNVRWSLNHVSDYAHDRDTEPQIDSHAMHDIVASVNAFDEKLTMSLAMLNAFDEPPPWVLRQLNYDPLTHSPLGRVIQVGLRWSVQ